MQSDDNWKGMAMTETIEKLGQQTCDAKKSRRIFGGSSGFRLNHCKSSIVAAAALAIGATMATGMSAMEQGTPNPETSAPRKPTEQSVIAPKALVSDVRSFGAVGDGKADDTKAMQQAIDAGGEIFIPSGTYLITKTLIIDGKRGGLIRGQGYPGLGPTPDSNASTSTLVWAGAKGGTLIKTIGTSAYVFQNLSLLGRPAGRKKEDGQAGVLYHAVSKAGFGNMVNKMENMGFYKADIGILMGGEGPDACNSDMLFDFVNFSFLDRGFVVKNNQGVDFTFNFLFGMNCGKVLHLEKGGNLLVNTAQMTNCDVFLEIGGGGRMNTYLCNNVRVESNDGGKKQRFQLLRSFPSSFMANVNFSGYADCQWSWFLNKTEKRMLPLCEIGPGSLVTIENSTFSGPVASVLGSEKAPASLILRECMFSYVKPDSAVSANPRGYFKIINPMTDKMEPQPDVDKWPEMSAVKVGSEQEHKGIEKNILKERNQHLLAGTDAPQALVANFDDKDALVGVLAKGSARFNEFQPGTFRELPAELIGKIYTYTSREAKPAGQGYSFTSMQNATLYLFVMERGKPNVPEDWEKTGMKALSVIWGKEYSEVIYKRKVLAGETIAIPPAAAPEGKFHHACAVVPEE